MDDVRLSVSGPKLVEHNLDDIINDSPVMLPVTRTGIRMTSPEADRGAGNRTLVGNQEAYQAVNATIAQIFTTDTNTSIQALSELDELMKDNRDGATAVVTLASMRYETAYPPTVSRADY